MGIEDGQELKHYTEISLGRKNIVDALKNLGFNYRYPRYYLHAEWGEIDISRCNSISDTLKLVFEMGRRNKAQEIRKSLGCID